MNQYRENRPLDRTRGRAGGPASAALLLGLLVASSHAAALNEVGLDAYESPLGAPQGDPYARTSADGRMTCTSHPDSGGFLPSFWQYEQAVINSVANPPM
jgi:hypothetical protein